MKWLPRSPSRGRVRDAKILCALTLKRERARNLERRSPKKWASPRPKAGKGTPKRRSCVFSFYETRTRFFLCPYLFSSQRRGAVFFPPPRVSHAFNTESPNTFLSLGGASGEKGVACRKV